MFYGVQARSYGVAWGDKCHPWTSFSLLLYSKDIFPEVWLISVSAFTMQFILSFSHIYPFDTDNCDDIKSEMCSQILCHMIYQESSKEPFGDNRPPRNPIINAHDIIGTQ